MSQLLIIGATGMLGNATAQQLLQKGKSVKIFVRDVSKAAHLQRAGAEIVVGDLINPKTVAAALNGVDAVLVAAHGMLGKGKYNSEKVDDWAHRHLIDLSVKAGIKQFFYTSVEGAAPDHPIDFWRTKYRIEQYLINSGLTYTILRLSAFMETHMHKLLGEAILKKGKTFILGKGENPTNFISVNDVAQVISLAYKNEDFFNRIIELGGPDNLTKKEVAALYGKHLNIKPRVTHISRGLLNTLSKLINPFHPGIARIMQVSVVSDTRNAVMSAQHTIEQFGIVPTNADEFVAQQVALYNRAKENSLMQS